MKRILVAGTSRPWEASARRAAQMVGATLAESGFGLVTGTATGVDAWAARGFSAAMRPVRGEVSEQITQISAGFFRRGSLLPAPGFRPGNGSLIGVKSVEEWMEEALRRSDAAIMVGGHKGALSIARRFIDAGKPVFAVPFSGGHSSEVFQEILKTWNEYPVPGLTRNQYVRLALPWVSGTGALLNLLRGALADTPDVFISYRRSDTAAAAGRLHRDLVEHFGTRRVFMDVHGIEPAEAWEKALDDAIQGCKAGVIVIGDRWTKPPRLAEPDDYVRREIRLLLEGGKAIAPVLIEGASLPERSELPEELLPLLRFQAPMLNNANWDVVLGQLIRQLERAITAE